MEHLVIKPTLACTAGCPTCAARRHLHRRLRTRPQLTFDDWARVLADAHSLGAWHLTISGGEPTLAPWLVDLVRTGKDHGWLVRMNSNGSFDGSTLAEPLVAAGLDVADVSLYSSDPSRHDAMRGARGLWAKATLNISRLAELQGRHPRFKVITQTILSRDNYRDLPDLIELNRRLGSSGMLVSYLEGDFEGLHRVSRRQVEEFRAEVLPLAIDAAGRLDPLVRPVATAAVRRLFAPDILSSDSWAAGVYRPVPSACPIPGSQALVLASGDVHPCNIVEYTHRHVVGNVLERPLAEIWNGRQWAEYRDDPGAHCRLCPMEHHVFIPLRTTSILRGTVRAALHVTGLGRLERLLVSLPYRRRGRGPRSLRRAPRGVTDVHRGR